MRRLHLLLVAACIALQAIDCIVGAAGHSHHHPAAGEQLAVVLRAHHHSACCHHADHATADPSDDCSAPAKSPRDEHHDCSLCRHFSQPVMPTVVTIELVGSQSIEPFHPPVIERNIPAVATTHSGAARRLSLPSAHECLKGGFRPPSAHARGMPPWPARRPFPGAAPLAVLST